MKRRLMVLSMLVLLFTKCFAEDGGKFSLGVGFTNGFGGKDILVGVTTTHKDITQNPGITNGFNLSMGYVLMEKYELELQYGKVKSPLKPAKVNGIEGNFENDSILLNFKYKIPLKVEEKKEDEIQFSDGFKSFTGDDTLKIVNKEPTKNLDYTMYINLVGGLGLYNNGKMYTDSQYAIDNYGHLVDYNSQETIKYDNGMGFQAGAEFEAKYKRMASIILGCYYQVSKLEANYYQYKDNNINVEFNGKSEIDKLKKTSSKTYTNLGEKLELDNNSFRVGFALKLFI